MLVLKDTTKIRQRVKIEEKNKWENFKTLELETLAKAIKATISIVSLTKEYDKVSQVK